MRRRRRSIGEHAECGHAGQRRGTGIPARPIDGLDEQPRLLGVGVNVACCLRGRGQRRHRPLRLIGLSPVVGGRGGVVRR